MQAPRKTESTHVKHIYKNYSVNCNIKCSLLPPLYWLMYNCENFIQEFKND